MKKSLAKMLSVTVTISVISLLSISSVSSSRPNIVFILADDYGFNDIGYHAQEHASAMKTPFLDKLARNGVKLENYYVQPVCSPTRSQLLSGRYQIHTGLQHAVIWPDQPNALPLKNKILPEQLRDCGYDTHMVGKWHLGFYKDEFLPWNRGFNSYYGFLIGGEDYFTHARCYKNACGGGLWSSKYGPVNDSYGEYSANLFSRKAMEAIDSRDPAKPFFLYLAYQSVHSPMQVPQKYIEPFMHIKDKNRRIYAGMVHAMDESIENVTNHLARAGMLDNTIIIFSTDNGGQTLAGGNNWPLRGRKGTLWEGGVRGVGFAYGNALSEKGIVHNGLLHVSDWFPTLLGASGCPVINGTQPLDGLNQWDAINQRTKSPRTEILHNIDPLFGMIGKYGQFPNSGFNLSVHAAVRRGPWKLLTGDPGFSEWVRPPESQQGEINGETDMFSLPSSGNLKDVEYQRKCQSKVQLFHIETDPYEHNDLANNFPDVVKEMLQLLAKYNATAVPVRYPAHDPRANPKFNKGFWGPWLN